MSELENAEKEQLSSFLHSALNVTLAMSGNRVSIDSGQLSPEGLKKIVNKFVYHKNLNGKYWVALEGNVVKINKFEKSKKKERRKERITQPSTIKHGW